jgi:hypothetical protein
MRASFVDDAGAFWYYDPARSEFLIVINDCIGRCADARGSPLPLAENPA